MTFDSMARWLTPAEIPYYCAGLFLAATCLIVHEFGHIRAGAHFALAGRIRLRPRLWAEFLPYEGQVMDPRQRAIIAMAGPLFLTAYCLIGGIAAAAALPRSNPRWLVAILCAILTQELLSVIAGYLWVQGSDGWHLRQAIAGHQWDCKRHGVKEIELVWANLFTLPVAIAVGIAVFAAMS